MLFRDAAVLQHRLHRILVNHQRLCNLILLVHRDHAAELIVHRLHDLHAAFLLQRTGEHRLKAPLLLRRRLRNRRVEHRVDEILVALIHLACVAQRIVQIGLPVVKGRKQESDLRRRDQMVAGKGVELLLMIVVSQSRLGLFDRTDTADQIGEHLLRAVLHVDIVLGAVRDIVRVEGHQDQIIALQIDRVDDLLIKRLPRLRVLQTGLAQFHEQSMLRTVHDLLIGKRDVQQIASERAGQRFFEQGEIGLGLLLRRERHGLLKGGDHGLVFIDITSIHLCDGVMIRTELTAQLRNFFFIHLCCSSFKKNAPIVP